MAEIKYVLFNLGEQKYSMKLSRINGIEQTYNIVPVPKGAECIRGIIHLRNTIVPVYDLKYRFEIDSELEEGNKQLLVTETKGIKVGFEADHVIGIFAVPEEDIKKVPRVATNDNTGYLENIIKVNFAETNTSEIMISIDVDSLLSENDMIDLQGAIDEMSVEEETDDSETV